MSGAPAWVSYAALALSAGSLAVSALSFRAGGPRLRVRASRAAANAPDNPFRDGVTVYLTVTNTGRAAADVASFWVTPYGSRRVAVPVGEYRGPSLPHRLEAHSTAAWWCDALPLAHDYDARIKARTLRPRSTWPSQFRFTVVAGNGRRSHTGNSFDSLRIIADSRTGV